MKRYIYGLLFGTLLMQATSPFSDAQQIEIPRRHDRPPNQPYSAEEAAARMTVPVGFSVEVVAAEPDVVNPVAMCIDERGRFWITESFEYPRREPGPGRDRVKILEDTDNDGKADKVTVFAEGLNIPSGIAVGYGGVWVCNAPDLLFMQDTDGDGKADTTKVMMTGFGRTDTHELPNSLTWGPDGWLYGLNGVFNYCHLQYGPDNPYYEKEKDRVWDFTCGLFRIHPRTGEFQIFAEGTSNPWGIAINEEGEFFLSACVIDHLWHIVESGYYIRQGGPYPPHTWPIRSIVQHKHQKAAYCGITWFDSDAYPAEYNGVLYMGNIHGACINADIAERSGSTYHGKPHPGFPAKPGAWKDDQYGTIAKTGDPADPRLADFLTANDAWFMPVVQKVGPDGSLYVLDWYDRYHCYQDANADPAGIDRLKGRLYRVRYQQTPRAGLFNLNDKSDDELIALLGHPNVYYRDTAQRLLGERSGPEILKKLFALILDDSLPEKTRLCGLYAAAACGISGDDLLQLAGVEGAPLQGWVIRLMAHDKDLQAYGKLPELKAAAAAHPQLQLQQVIAASQLKNNDTVQTLLLDAMVAAGDQDHLHQMIWQNLIRRIRAEPELYLTKLNGRQDSLSEIQPILARSLALVSENQKVSAELIGKTVQIILADARVAEQTKADCLRTLLVLVENGVVPATRLASVMQQIHPAGDLPGGLAANLLILKALSGDDAARTQLRTRLLSRTSADHERIDALRTLVAVNDQTLVDSVSNVFDDEQLTAEMRNAMIEVLGRTHEPRVAAILVKHFSRFAPEVQPRVVEVLTQRPAWSLKLLKEIDAGRIDKSLVNLNQLRRMSSFSNEEVQQLVTKNFGMIRPRSQADRQGYINQKRDFLHGTPGDPLAGAVVFKRVCAQCHKIYGEGAEVGPDITRNGRNNWLQLLQNVFDPSAVIGPGYQARIVATEDGRVLTGLPVEDSPEKLVLKIQGGKLESIPRDQIEEDKLSELSLMPEDVEKLMTPQEMADLFAFLALDKPPTDPEAKILPGAPEQKRR